MKKDIPYLLFILLAVIILYSGLLFSPDTQLYPAKDWWSQHYFWKNFEKESFEKDGEIPLWNPATFSGAPFLGHPAGSTYFYPTNPLFLFNDANSIFKLYLLFHSLFAGISFFYLIRFLLEDRMISLFGSIAFIYGGAWIAKISFGQLTNMVVISYVPLLLLLLLKLWQKPKWTLSLLMGFVLGIQFNAGNQHLFYISALSLIFLIIYFSIEEIYKEKNIKQLLRKYLLLFLAAFIGMGISAGQLLPTMETAAWSIRTLSNYEYCTSLSLPLWQTLSFFYPNVFGTYIEGNYIGAENYTELYGYAGLFPLLLMFYFIFSKRKKSGYPFLMLAIVSLLLSFGRYTPVYKIFYKIIPGLNLFRIPATFLFIYIIALIVLGCYGLQSFLDDKDDKRKRKLFSILLMTFISVTVLLLVFHPLERIIKTWKPHLLSNTTLASVTYALIHALVLLAVFCVFYFLRIPRKAISILFILFMMLDLLLVGLPLLKTRDLNTVNRSYPWIEKISEDKTFFRIYDIKSVPQETSLQFGLQKITGLDPIILKHYFNFTNLLLGDYIPITTEQLPITRNDSGDLKNIVVLNLLNVKYIISNHRFDSFQSLILVNQYQDKEKNEVYLYENKDALPRAWIVHKTEEIEDFSQFRDKLKELKPREKAFVSAGSEKKIASTLIDDTSISKNTLTSENVTIKDYKSNRIIMSVDADRAGLLIISEVWMPGWIAKVNGKPAPVIRTNYILRGIPVEKGKSWVELRYFPKSFPVGVSITFLFSVIVLILLIIVIVHKIMAQIRPYAKMRLLEKQKHQ